MRFTRFLFTTNADSNCFVHFLHSSCSLNGIIPLKKNVTRNVAISVYTLPLNEPSHCISYGQNTESLLQMCYIGLLITDAAFMLRNSYKTLRETLIHSSIFIYLRGSGCQIRVDMSSFPVKKKSE